MPRLIRTRTIVLLLAVPVGLLLLYDLVVAVKGIGSIRYCVRVVSSVPVREVRYESFPSSKWAEETVHYKVVDRREAVRPEEWEGDQFSAWVEFITSDSGLRWRSSFVQHRYLLIVAVLADGRRAEKLVELPHADESQEVTVALD